MTQEKLAERADLNLRTVQRIEAGETNILITTARRLKLGVGCPWSELLTEESSAD
jgi:transcriptional regulator with XRE-family HTH domain